MSPARGAGLRTRASALPAPFIDQVRRQRGPAGLVAGAEARAIVTVEMLVEQDGIAPMRIVLKLLRAAEDRPASRAIALENSDQPLGDGSGQIVQSFGRMRGVELEQTLHQKIIGGKPDGATPVRIAALEFNFFLGWFIAHATVAERERMLPMEF